MLFLKHLLLLVFVLLVIACDPSSSNSPAQLQRIAIQSQVDQQERDFYLYLPQGYENAGEQEFPVFLFLHGNGERGNGKEDLDYTLVHGPLFEAWVQKRNLPFILVVPQLPMFGRDTMGLPYIDDRNESWIPKRLEIGVPEREADFSTDFPMLGATQVDTFPGGRLTLPEGWDVIEKDLLTMLELVLKNYRADPSRIYLGGLSYGGFGTWWMASKHPDLFAAINPVVGWGHPDLMEPIAKAKIPVWTFCGGRDEVVPCRYFYKGLNRLETLGHPEVRFTIEEDMGHDVWRRVYAGEDIYQWLLSHRKE